MSQTLSVTLHCVYSSMFASRQILNLVLTLSVPALQMMKQGAVWGRGRQ